MIILIQIILSCLQLVVLAGLSYYYLLLAAAAFKRKSEPLLRPARSHDRFAVIIPAHNEALVIGNTVERLRQQSYPHELFDIYVVADHCSDATAAVAREAGAICFERTEEPSGRKAYALHWLLERVLHDEKRDYWAIAIFDADSQVDSEFLSAMSERLNKGHKALQGQHVIWNPGDSVFSQLAAIDMRLNNLLRNQAKDHIGLSCRLMGDAMCLETSLIRELGWGGKSLIEDREFEIHLLLAGKRVRYVPGAVSYGQASSRWRDASKQRMRWYSGVMQLQRQYILPLGRAFRRTRDLAVLDRIVELLLPSYSWLSVMTVALLTIQMLAPGLSLAVPWPLMLLAALAWFTFPFIGLKITQAPRWCYRTMVYAPAYLLWRIWQGVSVAARGGHVEWIRTRRREESQDYVR
jgi:cellulose synthase/poly-beta-1,6-N-acetylglucosamine synthase-like glycosyltransferase